MSNYGDYAAREKGPYFKPDLKVDVKGAKIKMNFVDEKGQEHNIRVKTFSDDFAGKAKSFFYTKILRTYVETKNPTREGPLLVKVSKAAKKLGVSEKDVRDAAKTDDFQTKVLALRGQKQTQVENPAPDLRSEAVQSAEFEKNENKIRVVNLKFRDQIESVLKKSKSEQPVKIVCYCDTDGCKPFTIVEGIPAPELENDKLKISEVNISNEGDFYYIEFGKNTTVVHMIEGERGALVPTKVDDQKSILDKLKTSLQQMR